MKNRTHLRRRLMVFAAACLLSITALLTNPTQAMASADTCTGAPFGYVCVNVQGDYSFIDTLSVIRGSVSGVATGICNWRADAWVDNPLGQQIKFLRHDYDGCNYGRAWVDFNLDHAWFPCGSKVYAAFYQGGIRQGGYAGPVTLC